MKRISLEALLAKKGQLTYRQQYDYMIGLLDAGRIRPLKASGKNGKRPALYLEYWLLEEQDDPGPLLEELKYTIVPAISIDYYLSHPEVYRQERSWVLLLNAYFKEQREKLKHPVSVNERSFAIWGREKFLTKEQGRKILKHCGVEPELLNMYETAEPLAYYAHTRDVPQNLLLLENKDPFYSMRRHLLQGETKIFGVPVGTLVYGAGKGILRSFPELDHSAEPYMLHPENRFYYFGDLDYEGIGIWEHLAGQCPKHRRMVPFVPAYEAMLRKVQDDSRLPDTKEQQNRNISGSFFTYFPAKTAGRMREILESGRYIPQEILNTEYF